MEDFEAESGRTRISRSGLIRQIITSVIISLAPLNAGMTQGWLSPLSLKLMAEDSPVGAMTKEELSTLATIPSYPLLVLAFVIGYVANTFGRKPALFMVGIPSVASGVILTLAPSKTWMYIGRALNAFTSNGILLSGMYVSETAHESIRGILITICSVQINVGILLSYVAGKALSYKAFNALMIALPCTFTILLLWLPESPHFLLDKGRRNEAKKSMLWLGGGNDQAAEQELRAMEPSGSTRRNESQTIFQAFKTKGAKRALTISVFSFCLQTVSGIHIILNYSGIIFKEAGSPLSPGDSAIITASIILVASCINMCLIDKLGRKPLLYISFTFGSLSFAVLSAFLFVQKKGFDVSSYGWIPLFSLGLFVFVYGIGLSSVPGVLTNEVSPAKIKPAVSSINTACMVISVITVLQSFPYLDEYVGLYSIFVIPCIMNLIGVVFTWFVVPETKGKSLTQIANELNSK